MVSSDGYEQDQKFYLNRWQGGVVTWVTQEYKAAMAAENADCELS